MLHASGRGSYPVSMEHSAPSPTLAPQRHRARLRRTRTREALLAAARRLMADSPREAFTVDEVVQAAAVAKGSFYNHFPDKEALASEVLRLIRKKEEEEVGSVNKGITDPVARVARGMAVYARFAITAPEDARILALRRLDELLPTDATGGLMEDLREGLRLRRIVVISIEAGAMLVVGQVAVLMSRLHGVPDADDASLLAAQSIATTLVGLGTPAPEALLIASRSAAEIFGDRTAV